MADGWGWTVTRSAVSVVGALALGACVAAPGCTGPTAPEGYAIVELDGRPFTLEIVADPETRERGLGGRESIPEDGGMLFSFPDAQVRQFVMRDCLFPIDILFLDSDGVIVAKHHMPLDEPRREGESDLAYERRLKRYSSRFNARYAIEIQGGLLEGLDLQTGERVGLDTERLAAMTR